MLWSAVRARQWALHFDRPISRPSGQLVGFFLADKVDSKRRPAVDSNPPARAWPGSGADSGPLSAAQCLPLRVQQRAIESDKGSGC